MSAYRKNTVPGLTTIRTLSAHQRQVRDLTWGRPVFKAPHLPNPRTVFDPLPFTAFRPSRQIAGKTMD